MLESEPDDPRPSGAQHVPRTRPDASEEAGRRARELVASVPLWHHRIEVIPGLVTPGVSDTGNLMTTLDLPEDCSGMRVLDVGARDGFFSFALERRGAEVLAMDVEVESRTGFAVAKELLSSSVEYVVDNAYNLSAAKYGKFDLVLFLGVLYHLRHPLLALDRLWDVCADRLVVETVILDGSVALPDGAETSLGDLHPVLEELRLAQFHPLEEFRDISNWWVPSASCVEALLQAGGFAVERRQLANGRGVFWSRRVDDVTQQLMRSFDRSASLDDIRDAYGERALHGPTTLEGN